VLDDVGRAQETEVEQEHQTKRFSLLENETKEQIFKIMMKTVPKFYPVSCPTQHSILSLLFRLISIPFVSNS
jgi:hypothetical protein